MKLASFELTGVDLAVRHRVSVAGPLSFVYVLFRAWLRLLFRNKEKRDRFIARVWPTSNSLPLIFPQQLRFPVVYAEWIRMMEGSNWEPEVTCRLRQIKRKLFIDVGANLGYYCRQLRSNFTEIIAIEANSYIYRDLLKRLPENCKAINVAISNKDGAEVMLRNPENCGNDPTNFGGYASLDTHGMTRGRFGFKARTTTLDTIIGDRQVDLIKVDIEGAEWQALEGAKKSLPNIKCWLIELHDHQRRKRELEDQMRHEGYACEWIDKGHALFTQSHSRRSAK